MLPALLGEPIRRSGGLYVVGPVIHSINQSLSFPFIFIVKERQHNSLIHSSFIKERESKQHKRKEKLSSLGVSWCAVEGLRP